MLRRHMLGLALLAGLLSAAPARAVMVNGSPAGNTGDPGTYGWNYVGSWSGTHGNGSGVAIAPNAFLTAHHIGGTDTNVFNLNGTDYNVVANGVTNIAGTDLDIVTVNGTFGSYATLATSLTSGDPISMVGFGSHSYDDQNPVVTNGTANGWMNDPANPSTKSWGLNDIEQADVSASDGDTTYEHMIRIDFDNVSGEAVLAHGDSGGGMFVQVSNGQWELAGINYAINEFYRDQAGVFVKLDASIYDTTGLSLYPEDNSLATDLGYDRENAYATNVAYYRNDILGLVTLPAPEPASLLLIAPAVLLLMPRRRREGVRG